MPASFASATTLTVTEINRTSPVSLASALTAVDGTNGNKFDNDGQTFLRVKNASGAPITGTIDTPGTVQGLAIADLTFTVGATTGDVVIGPLPPVFNQPGTSQVWVTFSSGTSVTAMPYRLSMA